MPVRGVRGAITVVENSKGEVLDATRELLQVIIERNELDDFSEIVSAVFTTSPDLTAAFPAEAARELGMEAVPLLCASEINVPNSLSKVIRILLHVNTEKKQSDMVHVYLRGAQNLRKDITSAQ